MFSRATNKFRQLMVGCAGIVLITAQFPVHAEFAKADSSDPVYRTVDRSRFLIHNTWLVGGYFSEAHQSTFTEITLYSPEFMQFEWGTTIQDADHGFWRLSRKDPVAAGATPTYTQLATGVAGPTPGGRFAIDLKNHLPANAPSTAQIYHVQVIARTESTTDNSATQPGQSGAKIPAQTLGLWSDPVVITYGGESVPITRFEFHEVYRKATLVLDEISLVEDQYGPGGEEYFVAGFVQELFRNCSGVNNQSCPFDLPGKQSRFAPDLGLIDLTETCDSIMARPYFRCLLPPVDLSPFGMQGYYFEQNRFDFHLDSQASKWPRNFSVAISLLEQDDGDLLHDWIDGVDFVADQSATGDLFALNGLDEGQILDYLEDAGFGEEDIANIVLHMAEVINTAATASGAAAVVGAGGIIIYNAIAAILEDKEDDYYGTEVFSLTLPSNRVAVIQSLPGHASGVGAYEKYVLEGQTMRFYGPPPANSASSFDGIVDITFHWEFSEIEDEI